MLHPEYQQHTKQEAHVPIPNQYFTVIWIACCDSFFDRACIVCFLDCVASYHWLNQENELWNPSESYNR